MIPHVKLSDNKYLIPTPEGPKYITPESFNYHKILSMLPTHTVADILPLFTPPETPNGVYRLYTDGETLMCFNVQLPKPLLLISGTWKPYKSQTPPSDMLIGVFTSLDEIQDAFPEYFI